MSESSTQEASSVTTVSDVFEPFVAEIKRRIGSSVDEAKVKAIIDEQLKKAAAPKVHKVVRKDVTVTLPEEPHAAFGDMLKMLNEGHSNLMLVGPAGSGKTTLAKNVAHALGLQFGFISLSAGVTETHLCGRLLPQKDGSWEYQASRFVEVYEQGGVFLLDEMDAADANVMVQINAALANGVFANPNGRMHERHKDTVIIAACNTWGNGADQMYVGRNALDAATRDRFVLSTMYVDYDPRLERRLATAYAGVDAGAELIDWIKGVRSVISSNKLRRIASTRLLVNAAKAVAGGASLKQVQERYTLDWSADERKRLEGAAK